MTNHITILYAFRNRDAQRVKLSLQSLQQQTTLGFEVVFVDYGSDAVAAQAAGQVVASFDFASYHYVGHPGLLWNKSKALNYGIRQAKTAYILINDVDVILHPKAMETFQNLCAPETYTLFKIGYLPKTVSQQQVASTPFEQLKPGHTGDTFGIGLFPKAALEQVQGLDEFFHFYGSEDEDLNARLQNAGFKQQRENQLLFLHLWHPRYPQKKDKQLSVQPRLYNAQRINQQHFLSQKQMNLSIAAHQEHWGHCIKPEDKEQLATPEVNVRLPNIEAVVVHFLNEALKHYKGKVVAVTFYEEAYYTSIKYKLKTLLGKQSQPYCSMKEVNDVVLKEIVFKYRHANYSFSVSENLKEIHFVIAL